MSDGPSRILFPLATTVEPTYANDVPYRESLLKMATVLYDEVLFERGAYTVSIAEDGAIQHEWADDEAVDYRHILTSPGPFTRLNLVLHLCPGDRTGDGQAIEVLRNGEPVTEPISVQREFDMCVEYASEIEHSLVAALAEFNTGWLMLMVWAEWGRQGSPCCDSVRSSRVRRPRRGDKVRVGILLESRW